MATRRDVLKTALGAFGAANMGAALHHFSAQAADVSGYKALVCVFLKGGLDGHDVLLPYDRASYAEYADIRQSLLSEYASAGARRARADLLELTPSNQGAFGARGFAFPPEWGALHGLFEAGKAAVVANVGPLIEPTSRTQFFEGGARLPARLFSHNDQRSTWQASAPEGAPTGWGGRFLDAALAADTAADNAFSAISTAGTSVFVTGDVARQYHAAGEAPQIEELLDPRLRGSASDSDRAYQLLVEHFRSAGATRSHLFERDIVDANRRALDVNARYADAYAQRLPLNVSFPAGPFGEQLQLVAEAISIRSELSAKRQVFYVAGGEFDTHSGQAGALPAQLEELSQTIRAFYDAMTAMGLENNVTLFTGSDFGRTLVSNRDGTDHGWGGHHLVVGGAVNGGQIFGAPPPSTLGHGQDAGNGRLIPTTSVEQYAATLGSWFGLTDAELSIALPALRNFSNRNLGFI